MVLEVLPGGWVVEVDRVGGEVVAVVCWWKDCFHDTSGAKGGRVVVADVKGYRVGSWRLMCSAFHGKVLRQGQPGGRIQDYVMSPSSVPLGSSATSRC